MQATFTYLLTEQAQRAQMAATGQPVARKQAVVEELPLEFLASPYTAIAADGSITVDLTQTVRLNERGEVSRGSNWTSIEPELDAQPESGCAALRSLIAALAAKRASTAEQYRLRQSEIAERDQRENATRTAAREARRATNQQLIDAFLADPAARAVHIAEYPWTHIGTPFAGIAAPIVPDWVDLGSDDNRVRIHMDVMGADAIVALVRVARQRNDADAAAKEALKAAAIDAFVAASGDAWLIGQHKEGLLCRKTIISRMATAALDACGLPAACPDSIVCNNRECPCEDSTVDCIPPAIYRTWKAFTLPEGSTVEFYRVRNCFQLYIDHRDGTSSAAEDCGDERFRWAPHHQPLEAGETAGPTEYHAVVTIPSGPFQFTRRVKLEGK